MIMLPLPLNLDDSKKQMLLIMALSLEGPRHSRHSWLASVASAFAVATAAAYLLSGCAMTQIAVAEYSEPSFVTSSGVLVYDGSGRVTDREVTDLESDAIEILRMNGVKDSDASACLVGIQIRVHPEREMSCNGRRCFGKVKSVLQIEVASPGKCAYDSGDGIGAPIAHELIHAIQRCVGQKDDLRHESRVWRDLDAIHHSC